MDKRKENAKRIMKRIIDAGYEAYLVGGCVRDNILGRTPQDYDIATNMPMKTIQETFDKVIDTGSQFGTLTILVDRIPYEVTQFRRESYDDGTRKPVVTFGESIYEDLKRRDLTINAIAEDIHGDYIYNGNHLEDLLQRRFRFVGNPIERVSEDPLRILRAIRFIAKYNLILDSVGHVQLINLKDEVVRLKTISPERIQEELSKGLMLDNVETYLNLLFELDVFKILIPELHATYRFDQKNHHHEYLLHDHLIKGVHRSVKNLRVRWAVLLHDIGKIQTVSTKEDGEQSYYGHASVSAELAEDILRRLHFSNRDREFITKTIYHHMDTIEGLRMSSIKRIYDVFTSDIEEFILVLLGDAYGHEPSETMIQNINRILVFQSDIRTYLEKEGAFSLKDLAFNGHDLMERFNLKPSKQIGEILDHVFEKVINHELQNEKEVLFNYVKHHIL